MRQSADRLALLGVLGAVMIGLAGCGSSGPGGVYKLGQPYQIAGRWYYPEFDPDYDKVGIASCMAASSTATPPPTARSSTGTS